MTEFAASIAGLVLGVILGQFIRFRRVDTSGRKVLKPEIDTRPFHSRILNVALVTMFLITTGTTVWFTWTQRECNAQFQGSLKNNSAINAQDRALEVRDDALRDDREDAMDILIGELLGPGVQSSQQVHDLLEGYRLRVAGNDADRSILNTERRDLERQRQANPYPEARC